MLPGWVGVRAASLWWLKSSQQPAVSSSNSNNDSSSNNTSVSEWAPAITYSVIYLRSSIGNNSNISCVLTRNHLQQHDAGEPNLQRNQFRNFCRSLYHTEASTTLGPHFSSYLVFLWRRCSCLAMSLFFGASIWSLTRAFFIWYLDTLLRFKAI